MPDAEFTVVSRRISRGDALLMYTDGLVETPTRDISLGIDKLLGQGERLLRAGFEQGAAPARSTRSGRSTTTARCSCCTGADQGRRAPALHPSVGHVRASRRVWSG